MREGDPNGLRYEVLSVKREYGYKERTAQAAPKRIKLTEVTILLRVTCKMMMARISVRVYGMGSRARVRLLL